MSEKIDIRKLERELHACKGAYFETEDIAEVLALVHAVRAARGLVEASEYEVDTAWFDLKAALAPFTDSAETSDG